MERESSFRTVVRFVQPMSSPLLGIPSSKADRVVVESEFLQRLRGVTSCLSESITHAVIAPEPLIVSNASRPTNDQAT